MNDLLFRDRVSIESVSSRLAQRQRFGTGLLSCKEEDIPKNITRFTHCHLSPFRHQNISFMVSLMNINSYLNASYACQESCE
jgi:hypothetical protein